MPARRGPSASVARKIKSTITKSSGDFEGGFKDGPPRLLTKGEQKFFGTTKKTARRESIEKRVRGVKKGTPLTLFQKKSAQ